MPFTGLRRLFRFNTKPRSRPQRNAKKSPGLRLELLEARELLAQAVWTGASTTSNNWSDTTNWQGGARPNAGDDIVFPPVTTRLNPSNDLGFLTYNSITISGSGYTLGGTNAFFLNNGISATNATGTNTINVNPAGIFLNAQQSFLVTNSGATLNLNGGTISNQGNTLTVGGAGNESITGVISGVGGLTKTGAGTVTLSGGNFYQGNTAINAGTVIVTT